MNYPINFGHLVGNIFALLSAISFASYTFFLSKINYDFISTAPVIYLMSSIFMIPILPLYGIGKFNLTTLLGIMGLVLVPTLIGHGSIIYTANKLPISLVTSSELIEPIIATILAIFIFNQIPTLQEILGGSITLISIYISFSQISK